MTNQDADAINAIIEILDDEYGVPHARDIARDIGDWLAGRDNVRDRRVAGDAARQALLDASEAAEDMYFRNDGSTVSKWLRARAAGE